MDGNERTVRPPLVAGLFYPSARNELRRELRALLDRAQLPEQRPSCDVLKALIVPHAGYVYSGSIAASAYRLIEPPKGVASQIRRVVLLGPSHRTPLRGLAIPTTRAFATPLGEVLIDRAALDAIAGMAPLTVDDRAHSFEHSLEVQIPFLQILLGSFSLAPIAVGACAPQLVSQVLDRLWGGPETLIVVSSDLSHFHAYEQASQIDRATSIKIQRCESTLVPDEACGCYAVNGLLLNVRKRGLAVQLLDLRNSGDTAGDRDRVVGYGSFAIHAA